MCHTLLPSSIFVFSTWILSPEVEFIWWSDIEYFWSNRRCSVKLILNGSNLTEKVIKLQRYTPCINQYALINGFCATLSFYVVNWQSRNYWEQEILHLGSIDPSVRSPSSFIPLESKRLASLIQKKRNILSFQLHTLMNTKWPWQC